MINVLFISCYSIDINNSASIELIYYMNLLAESGEFKVHLLTMDFPRSSIYYDPEISKLVHKDIVLHRVKGGAILNRVLPKNNINNSVKIGNSKLIRLKNLINVVDPYLSWSYKAYDYFRENLYNLGFNVILGMHEPPSSLICAHMIKKFINRKNCNVRFVSYFSDPYCDEPNRKCKNFFIRKINNFIERKIVNSSDRFLFVTRNNFKYFHDKYKINYDHVSFVHRNFDKAFVEKFRDCYPNEFVKGKINLLHAGDIVRGVRDVSNFIKALDYINENYNNEFKKYNVNFFGNIKDADQLSLIRDRNYINFKSRISYFKTINFMVHADILVVFGNREFKQIPAKIYDYIATNSYILIVLDSYEDPLYKLVENLDGVECVLNDYNDIINVLVRIADTNMCGVKNFKREIIKDKDVLDRIKKVFYN